MSIFATWLSIDDEDHNITCAHYEPCTRDEAEKAPRYIVAGSSRTTEQISGKRFRLSGGPPGDDRYYCWLPDAVCTCSNPAPIIYQGSHVSPDSTDLRGGSVTFCAIPNHCHPSVRGMGTDEGPPVEFARLWVTEDPATYHGGQPGSAVVILERAQVERLCDTLTRWLDSKERW